MVVTVVESISAFLADVVSYMPPGLVPAFATAFLEGGKYMKDFRHEFVGTLLMIACTFSAGKWWGKEDRNIAWVTHAFGVIAADYIGGGPHVNPAMTTSMFTLGKCSYTEAFVRVSAQLAGGLVAFPLYHAVSNAMKWEPFGGPEFKMDDDAHAAFPFLSEFFSTMLLCFAIYTLNWELHFGTFHYLVKQTLTAVAIRILIEYFPTSGPAMNPMLATTWNVFGVGETYAFPNDFHHYFVYWIAPCSAAILASVMYVIYAGGTVFGMTLPIGPLKGEPKKKKD